ncbi:restriction endonuclease subunit S [Vibrio harveyi]|uniref:restriction endonuclease subunit S n=1 Tax=Vibrio harveyi TaxID=669 RepID=UPI00237EF60E|nr:restriction endonuclease subunit S [Vibrio harveyi]HDM8055022.1 restriction endonuclease subunit S [Vibrio harveyi]
MKLTIHKIPEQWVVTTIGNICDVQSGIGFPKQLQGREDGEVPFFKVGDISNTVQLGSRYLSKANNYISKSEVNELKGRLFLPETIVFAKIGEAIKLNRRAILSQPSLVDNNVMGIKAYQGIDLNYLYHFMCFIKLDSLAKATTVPSIRKGQIEDIEVPLPSTSNQKSISSKIEELFSHIDAGVEGLKQAKSKLQQYRQSVLKDAVTGKLTEQWRAQNADKLEPAEQLLERILDERRANWEAEQLKAFEEKGKTPKNDKWKDKYKESVSPNDDVETDFPTSWQVVSPDMIFASVTDGDHQAPPKVSDGIPFLVIGDVNTGEIKFGDKRFVPQEYYDAIKDERKPEKGDLLYTVVGSYGIPVKVETETPFCVQRHIAILKPSLEIIRDFYFHVFNSGFVYSQATAVATGTAQKTVSLGGLRSFKLPLPPKIEQEKIAELVEEKLNMAYKTEATVDAKIEHASFLKSSILARAFSGELVPNASNESAGELLDKIKLEKDSIVRTKQKRSTKRKKKVTPRRKPLLTVLNEQSEPLKPDELMQLAGFLSNEVEEFYIELAEIAEQIEQLSPDTEQIKNWPYEKESEIKLKLKG